MRKKRTEFNLAPASDNATAFGFSLTATERFVSPDGGKLAWSSILFSFLVPVAYSGTVRVIPTFWGAVIILSSICIRADDMKVVSK